VRVTVDPGAKLAVHTVPQSMPAGLDVTRALPEPPNATLNVQESTNPAVADFAASMTKLQELANPLHAPPQPLKTEVAVGFAVSLTSVP
jgi:hypothetical protein